MLRRLYQGFERGVRKLAAEKGSDQAIQNDHRKDVRRETILSRSAI